jgi:hypothetical protein
MRLFPIAFCLLFLAFALPALATERNRDGGDFSGSGGGGGVACFPTEALASQAEASLAQGKPLSDALLAQAKIRVLELWEMEAKQASIRTFAGEKDWRKILEIVKSDLRMASPLFVRKMEIAADWMQFSSWEKTPALSRLEDANPTSPIPANCRRIQLALRYSDGNHKKGEGPVSGKLRLKVVFDERLFAALSPADQAALVLHETFYAMAQAVGHGDSDQVRNFVRVLFNTPIEGWGPASRRGIVLIEDTWFIQQKLIENLGDYVLFFTDLDLPEVDRTKVSAERNFAAFLEVVRYIRKVDSPCRKSNPAYVCHGPTMDKVLARTDYQPDEAFVLLSYFLWHQTARKLNAESVMDITRDEGRFGDAMGQACALLDPNSFRVKNPTILKRANEYCEAWRVQP